MNETHETTILDLRVAIARQEVLLKDAKHRRRVAELQRKLDRLAAETDREHTIAVMLENPTEE